MRDMKAHGGGAPSSTFSAHAASLVACGYMLTIEGVLVQAYTLLEACQERLAKLIPLVTESARGYSVRAGSNSGTPPLYLFWLYLFWLYQFGCTTVLQRDFLIHFISVQSVPGTF